MTGPSRVETQTKVIAVFIAITLPLAAFTASAVPWRWQFPLAYFGMAFALQLFVRLKNPAVERFAHVLVLSGSAPVAVRFYFGNGLTAAGVVHLTSVLVAATAVGYLLANRVRPEVA
jgi:hypothetical protein